MSALEAWLHERGGDGIVKRNCKLSVEQSGMDNLQSAETGSYKDKGHGASGRAGENVGSGFED